MSTEIIEVDKMLNLLEENFSFQATIFPLWMGMGVLQFRVDILHMLPLEFWIPYYSFMLLRKLIYSTYVTLHKDLKYK